MSQDTQNTVPGQTLAERFAYIARHPFDTPYMAVFLTPLIFVGSFAAGAGSKTFDHLTTLTIGVAVIAGVTDYFLERKSAAPVKTIRNTPILSSVAAAAALFFGYAHGEREVIQSIDGERSSYFSAADELEGNLQNKCASLPEGKSIVALTYQPWEGHTSGLVGYDCRSKKFLTGLEIKP